LATLLIRLGLGGSLIGVILINLVPTTPFVILILTPFIEQVDVSLIGKPDAGRRPCAHVAPRPSPAHRTRYVDGRYSGNRADHRLV